MGIDKMGGRESFEEEKETRMISRMDGEIERALKRPERKSESLKGFRAPGYLSVCLAVCVCLCQGSFKNRGATHIHMH